MISINTRRTDAEDVATLFFAICQFGLAHGGTGALEDVTLASVGMATLMERAQFAAGAIADQCGTGDDDDGVEWWERLADTGPDSLAGRLFRHDADDEMHGVVLHWLTSLAGHNPCHMIVDQQDGTYAAGQRVLWADTENEFGFTGSVMRGTVTGSRAAAADTTACIHVQLDSGQSVEAWTDELTPE